MGAVNAELRVSGSDLDDLGHLVRVIHDEHRAFEDGENADPDDFFGSLDRIVLGAEEIMDWAVRTRADAARQGFAP